MINEGYVKKYCCEDLSLIENYALAIADTTQTCECHHRGEVLPCGRFSRDDLKKFGLFYKRPASELIFLTPSEHTRLHKKGVPKSGATKKAIGEAKKGVPLSEDHKKALSDALKGHSVSEEHRAKLSKKIMQFTKSGEFLREWSSMNEASRQLKINCGNICRCCNRKRKSAGGYIWKYAEDLSDMLESLFEHYRDATTADGAVF